MLDVETERYLLKCFILSLILSGGCLIVCYEIWYAAKILFERTRRKIDE